MREIPVLMPKMSMTMQEGTLLTWHKSAGDRVRSGEPVCDVATDKVDMEVEAPTDGTLIRILAAPEDVVMVGMPIAYIVSDADELLGGLLHAPEPEPAVPGEVGKVGGPATGTATPAAPGHVRRRPAVPLARARALTLTVDLESVVGSGPDGCIRVVDIERAAAAGTAPGAPDGRHPTAPARTPALRREVRAAATARRLAAGTGTPQLTLYADLDVDALAADRRGCDWTTLFVWTFAAALRERPELNASWADGRLTTHDHVGIAVAVDTPSGLLAPVLHDPHKLSPARLDERIRDLATRARDGKVPLASLSGATGTLLDLSGLSGLGAAAGQLPLTPPQATALVTGAVTPQPVTDGHHITIRMRCRAGLTMDQRVGDASEAARLLDLVNTILGDPDALHQGRRPADG